MLYITVKRIYKGPTYTIGHLYVNGIYVCDTLEDRVRVLLSAADKVKKETAIPAGRYRVVLSWSGHFQCMMPELLDVPYFTYVRIHWGNDKDDTDGCILVGENKVKGKVINSKKAYAKLMELIEPAWRNKEEIYIDVLD